MADDREDPKRLAQVEVPGATQEHLEEEASASLWQENRRVVVLGVSVAFFMVIANFTPLRAWITNVQQWKTYIDEFGLAAHGGFAMVCLVAVMMGVPRLPLCGVAGMLFGFMEGLVISWIGSALGSYLVFLMARWGGRRVAEERLRRWPWLQELLKAPSLIRVFWVRQLMVPGVVLNVMLGLTAVKDRVFLAGTFLGYLPLNIAFALVGSGLGKESLKQSIAQVLAAMAVVNVVAWLVLKVARKHGAHGVQADG